MRPNAQFPNLDGVVCFQTPPRFNWDDTARARSVSDEFKIEDQVMREPVFKIVSMAALAAVLIARSAQAGLFGSSVNISAYFPNTSTVFESGSNTTVSSAVEYPVDSFFHYDRFAQIDITDNQLIIKNTLNMDAPFNSATFNGWALTVLSGPTISSATLDPASQFTPVGITVVNGDQVFVNFEGLTQGAGTSAIIDIAVVPEPSSILLLALALPLLLVAHKRS